MSGIDPCACLRQVSLKMNRTSSRQEIETVLDEMVYLFEDQGQAGERA